MSLEDFLSALISSRYEPCPVQPTPPNNDRPWTTYPELTHHFIDVLSQKRRCLPSFLDILDILLELRTFPAKPICNSSNFSAHLRQPQPQLDWVIFDGVDTETHVTNTSGTYYRSDTPIQSQSSSPPHFEPTNCAFTPTDATRSFDTIDFWSKNTYFDGINGASDTDKYVGAQLDFFVTEDPRVNDFSFPDPPQGEGSMTEDSWRHHIDDAGRRWGGRWPGVWCNRPVYFIRLRPSVTLCNVLVSTSKQFSFALLGSTQRNGRDYPLSCARGGKIFGYIPQENSEYNLDMSLLCYSTHPGPSGTETRNAYLEPLRMVPPPPSEDYLWTQITEHTRESSYPVRGSPRSFDSSLPAEELSHARSVFCGLYLRLYVILRREYCSTVFEDRSSKKSLSRIQAPDPAVTISNAKFNTFGRIGRSKPSNGESSKAKQRPPSECHRLRANSFDLEEVVTHGPAIQR
ncbi:hypothetical protein F5146DRAFT_1125633 [Armillaria mellea]|nr:hypothetical protein F5146DRAFT_1125633 [Armillaria mellea]